MASVDPPTKCATCGGTALSQETDVLDTWFSSQLWPFATLGWPDETKELKYFYPTDTLVTGPDIIFFWVSRMVMMGLEFRGELPFTAVYFNGIIRDKQGRKMSKSLGNGIDPVEMVRKYSADAVRFSLLELSAEGQDINLSENEFEIGRNFINKLWNAFRFLCMNLEESDLQNASLQFVEQQARQRTLDLADLWILSRLQKCIKKVTRSLEQLKFHEAAEAFYGFLWREYCDWYLELIKPRLYDEDNPQTKRATLSVGVFVMKGILQLLHPFIPFITEEIWQKLRNEDDSESIMVSRWPVEVRKLLDEQAEKQMDVLQKLIVAIRNIRAEMNVAPGKPAQVIIAGKSNNGLTPEVILSHKAYFEQLAKVDHLEYREDTEKPKKAASAVVNNLEVYLPLEGLIDLSVERERLEKEISRIEKQLEALNNKLQSRDFLSKAPEDVISRERHKKVDFESSLGKLKSNLESILA